MGGGGADRSGGGGAGGAPAGPRWGHVAGFGSAKNTQLCLINNNEDEEAVSCGCTFKPNEEDDGDKKWTNRFVQTYTISVALHRSQFSTYERTGGVCPSETPS